MKELTILRTCSTSALFSIYRDRTHPHTADVHNFEVIASVSCVNVAEKQKVLLFSINEVAACN